MKRISLIATFACLAGLFFAGSALASGTANLNVTANVTATCAITGGTLAFGALDPTNPVAVNATSSGVSVTCTNGSAYTITDNLTSGSGTLSGTGTNTTTIPYSISYTATGTGTGSSQPIAISGTIAANTYSTAPADSYSNTVTLTVNP